MCATSRRATLYDLTVDGNLLPKTNVKACCGSGCHVWYYGERIHVVSCGGCCVRRPADSAVCRSKVVVLGSGWGASTFMKNLAPRVTGRAPRAAASSVPCLVPRLEALSEACGLLTWLSLVPSHQQENVCKA